MDASKLSRTISNLANAGRPGAGTPSTDETTSERLLNQPDLYARLFGNRSQGDVAPDSHGSGTAPEWNVAPDAQSVLTSRLTDQSADLRAFHLDSLLVQVEVEGPAALQATSEPASAAVVDDIVEEVLAQEDVNYRPELLATLIQDLDADTQAEVIAEILHQSDDALTDVTDPILVSQWLSPSKLNGLYDMGLLSATSQTTLANAYAAAWNRDLIPEGFGVGGAQGSMLDNFEFGGSADDFVDFFNAGNTREVREFRISFARHLNDTYVQPLANSRGLAAQWSNNTAVVAARLVTDPGVPQSVAVDFYEQTFGPGRRNPFVQFLESAVSGREDNAIYFNENEAYDPFIAFANVAQVPSTYDVHFDNSDNGAREQIGIDLSYAVGRAQADGGILGINYGGVLEGSEERRLNRLQSAVDVFEDHGTAILDSLSQYSNITLDNAGELQRAHPELVGFFAHTIGNTDLANRETARDVANGYFERQIDVINQNPNTTDPETSAERRAVAIASAAALATQDIRADQQSVADARRAALEFGVDTALSLIPIGQGATATRNALTEMFGDSVPEALIPRLAEELINSGSGKLTTSTKNALLDALIRQGGGGGTVATGQEFLNLTVNSLGLALEVEDNVIRDVDSIPGHVEEAYLRIIDKTMTAIGLDN